MSLEFNKVIKEIIREEILNLNEDLNRISLQTAVDGRMFGPVYHGTTTENRENIEREGFKIFIGAERGENIRHGYPGERDYAQGIPPPIHHLGYGVYFTTVKTIGTRFNQDSAKGLKIYYLDVPRLATINFASPKRMMEWWLQNGYDGELAKQGQQGRIDATKKMTETLMQKYDAVWFKGKTMYRVLDGDQIVVFDTQNIYQIDPALAGELEIGSKVRRTTDKFDYQYNYSTISGESRTLKTTPTISKGTIGVIVGKTPTEEIIKRWQAQIPPPDDDIISNAWFKDSQYIYRVKWNKGGTESNVLDKHIEPLTLKQPVSADVNVKQLAEVVSEEIQVDNTEKIVVDNIQKINTIQEAIIVELQDLLQEGVADKNIGKSEFNDGFRQWFGNSKVVDKRGQPLRVYHGTQKDFQEFKSETGMMYFSKTPKYASEFATNSYIKSSVDNPQKSVMPVYLSIQKPLDLLKYKNEIISRYEFARELENQAGININQNSLKSAPWGNDNDNDVRAWQWIRFNSNYLREQLKSRGFDGIFMYELAYTGEKQIKDIAYVIFDSIQAKSATGNNGEYSRSNSDITKEGVADRYAEKAFNISDPNVEMNAKALSGIKPEENLGMGELAGKIGKEYFGYYDNDGDNDKHMSVNIYMNPKRLDNFSPGVRGVSHNADGNLFVAQNDYSFYHSDVSRAVNSEGKYKIGNGYDVQQNITWYRIEDTNKFRYSGTFVNQTKNTNSDVIQKALKILRAKNPGLEFVESDRFSRS
jgi:hypothetical protein